MYSRRALSALSSSERQLLWSQWLRSGQSQCARCFHASLRSREGESSSPYNAPNQSESRKQRSTRISSELAMLNKGPPPTGTAASVGDMKGPGSATGAFHAPPETPGPDAGFLGTPNEMGDSGQRMGENEPSTREGPRRQLGRIVNTPEEMIGGAEPNPGHHQTFVEKAAARETEEQQQSNYTSANEGKRSYDPENQRFELLYDGYGASTIAGGNVRGVVRDRVKAIAISGNPDAKPRRIKWRDMRTKVRTDIIDKLAKGEYAVEREDIAGKSRVLKDVARLTSLNGSYLQGDGERVLNKVRQLLPASLLAPKEQQQQQRSAPVRK